VGCKPRSASEGTSFGPPSSGVAGFRKVLTARWRHAGDDRDRRGHQHDREAPGWRLASLGAALLCCAILIRPSPSPGPSASRFSDLIGPARAHWLITARDLHHPGILRVQLPRSCAWSARRQRGADPLLARCEVQLSAEPAERRGCKLRRRSSRTFSSTRLHIVRLRRSTPGRGDPCCKASPATCAGAPAVRQADCTLARELALTRSYVEVSRSAWASGCGWRSTFPR
jgi:hypothetical protein